MVLCLEKIFILPNKETGHYLIILQNPFTITVAHGPYVTGLIETTAFLINAEALQWCQKLISITLKTLRVKGKTTMKVLVP